MAGLTMTGELFCDSLRATINIRSFAIRPQDLDKMPVSKTPITPKESTELRSKILAAKPGQEGLNVIFAQVKAHLG
ncbi:hypothetical protein V496_01112 [Pseudogymnoascus sp. VKM F-4515 (FW-2607)]|nr:hypothetical protein V496_01112 [Pseudogymnoascus sp. VKM F-4515 (FW-2607)]